ncbi:MAG: cell division protein FtsA [Candidatus Kerfeldbacteria bacterium]|nr:cell division protein FtsA [Candidatus Kerfeldbacteria bacterium]
MARETFLAGLDLGSTAVRVVVGQRQPNDAALHIVGAAEHPSDGISKGVVASIEDAVSSISQTLEKVERMTGIPVEHATVGISGTHILSQDSHGVIAVARPDGEVKEEDVERAIEAAQAVATPPNYEILHVIPRSFTLDNQRGIKDPVGMSGTRLEVDAQIIQGLSAQLKNLTKCVYRTSVDIDELVLGVLGAAEACLTKRQRELGVTLVNIGGATTSMVVFEEGDVLHAKVLPVGAGHVTNDIAIGLRTSIELAEKVKLEYGTALATDVGKREEINLEEFEGGESAVVSRQHVAEIIEARLEEIFSMVDKELKAIDRSALLPAGIVLTGGGAKLPGVVDLGKKVFRLPASVGFPTNVTSAIDRVNDPSFTTAVGLALWGGQAEQKGGGFNVPGLATVPEMTKKIRGWFKNFF